MCCCRNAVVLQSSCNEISTIFNCPCLYSCSFWLSYSWPGLHIRFQLQLLGSSTLQGESCTSLVRFLLCFQRFPHVWPTVACCPLIKILLCGCAISAVCVSSFCP